MQVNGVFNDIHLIYIRSTPSKCKIAHLHTVRSVKMTKIFNFNPTIFCGRNIDTERQIVNIRLTILHFPMLKFGKRCRLLLYQVKNFILQYKHTDLLKCKIFNVAG